MRSTGAILILTQVFWLAGCIVGAKPRTVRNIPPPPPQQQAAAPAPAAAPGPLSSPQTNAELLPPPQPLNQEAVAAAQPPEQPAPAPAPAPQRTTANRRRQPAGPPQISPKPESEAAAQTPAPAPAAPDSPRIQEILPANEQKRLQEEADGRKREVRQVLAQARGRRLTRAQNDLRNTIESYLKLSDRVQALGDMRQADDLAQRAWILAKDLQSGR